MSIVNRLKQYMEYIGMPNTQFADNADIPRPTLSQILNGRNRKISNELLDKLHAAYPRLNIMWLLFGDGDIEINPNIQISEAQKDEKTQSPATEAPVNQQRMMPPTLPLDQEIPLRNSNIEEFVAENIVRGKSTSNESQDPLSSNPSQTPTISQDTTKKIKSIMVFYNDSSYEIFSPAQ